MFLHLSVILFTGGEVYTPGTDTLPGHTPRSHTPGHTHPPGHTHTPLWHTPGHPRPGADPGIGQKGHPTDIAEQSHVSEVSYLWPGSRAHLRAVEAFEFLKLKYAFSHILETFFSNFWIEWLEVCQVKQGSKILWHGSWKIDQLCDW